MQGPALQQCWHIYSGIRVLIALFVCLQRYSHAYYIAYKPYTGIHYLTIWLNYWKIVKILFIILYKNIIIYFKILKNALKILKLPTYITKNTKSTFKLVVLLPIFTIP